MSPDITSDKASSIIKKLIHHFSIVYYYYLLTSTGHVRNLMTSFFVLLFLNNQTGTLFFRSSLSLTWNSCLLGNGAKTYHLATIVEDGIVFIVTVEPIHEVLPQISHRSTILGSLFHMFEAIVHAYHFASPINDRKIILDRKTILVVDRKIIIVFIVYNIRTSTIVVVILPVFNTTGNEAVIVTSNSLDFFTVSC